MVFFLLDDLLELVVGIWSSSYASWALGFELQTLCLLLSMDSSRGRLRNQVVSSLVCLWWVIDLARFELKSRTVQLFYLILCSFGESRLLVSWCAGGRCGMASSDEDCGRTRRPGAEDRRWSHRLGTRWPGDWEVRWHRVRSAPYTWRQGARISWLSPKTKVDGFLVEPQNQGDWGFSSLGLKTGNYGLVIWT
jgi:hypothetical protein